MNGGIWDINRWGPHGPKEYSDYMHKLCKFLMEILEDSPKTQVIWMTTPPIRYISFFKTLTNIVQRPQSRAVVLKLFSESIILIQIYIQSI